MLLPQIGTDHVESRGHWGSRVGFILAAAGSAIGLGNIWKFPYITGEHGGGAFVLVYLGCIALVGLPVLTAEVLLGRASQRSPVSAFKKLGGSGTPWVAVGWLGVVAAFVILSYYSVVAGWAMHYTWLSLTGGLSAVGTDGMGGLFDSIFTSPRLNLFWHFVFMAATVGVVLGGIRKGVERWARILMPALFVMMLVMLANAFTLDGFGEAWRFVFGFHTEDLTAAGVLEALGHSFFTLSLGMGTMLTYGSYLHRDDDMMSASISIAVLDTLIALMAALILFPIIFTFGMEASQGPGLVFISVPAALQQLPIGGLLAVLFFGLLVFAALTSAISILEVTTAYLIDERGWTRKASTLLAGGLTFVFGIPSALSGAPDGIFGSRFAEGVNGVTSLVGLSWERNWFDTFDYLATNWLLPLGGLGIAVFTAWRLDDAIRHREFLSGSRLAIFYKGWLFLLKFVVPVAIVLFFLNATEIVSFGG